MRPCHEPTRAKTKTTQQKNAMKNNSPRLRLSRSGRIYVDGVDRGNILDARFERGWVILDGFQTNSDDLADRILALWYRARHSGTANV